MFALGRNIYPKDDIEELMKKNVLHVEAFTKGNIRFFFLEREAYTKYLHVEIVQKTPLQLYHNAALRLGHDQVNAIKLRLFKQNSTHMILDNLSKYLFIWHTTKTR